MDIVVANGFVMERCTFFSREYHCCVLHHTRCKCEDYNLRNSKPITNADRIRAMTDEKLADWLKSIRYSWTCVPRDNGNRCADFKDDCKACWLDWLKKEVAHE